MGYLRNLYYRIREQDKLSLSPVVYSITASASIVQLQSRYLNTSQSRLAKIWPSGEQALEDSWSPAPNEGNVRVAKNRDGASHKLFQDALDEATIIISQTSNCTVLNAPRYSLADSDYVCVFSLPHVTFISYKFDCYDSFSFWNKCYGFRRLAKECPALAGR